MLTDVHDSPPPEAPVDLSTLGLPEERILAPGIYFDLDEEVYHAAFALSSTGIKDLRVDPFLWWSKSPLNPRQASVLADAKESMAKALGKAFDARIICGKEYFEANYAVELTHADHPDSLRTADDLRGWLEARELKKSGSKSALIERAIAHDPTVQIWEAIEEAYRHKHAGKTFIEFDWVEKIEVAAKLIEAHPELSKALKGGSPQVSVVWTCEKTGIPLKARFDYLKQKMIVDLKTFEPRGDMPIDMAIGKEIGFRKYHIQSSLYVEAAAQIPRFIKQGRVFGTPPSGFLDALTRHPDKRWAWIFQIKGIAPQAFGYMLPESSLLWSIGNIDVDNAKHSFRHHLDVYGADPWLNPVGFKNLDDANIPAWSLN